MLMLLKSPDRPFAMQRHLRTLAVQSLTLDYHNAGTFEGHKIFVTIYCVKKRTAGFAG